MFTPVRKGRCRMGWLSYEIQPGVKIPKEAEPYDFEYLNGDIQEEFNELKEDYIYFIDYQDNELFETIDLESLPDGITYERGE